MPPRSSNEKAAKLEQFRNTMDTAFGELQRLASESKLGTLDKSWESLDRLEDLLLAVRQGTRKDLTAETIKPLAERYVGATLIRNTGGTWDLQKRKGEALPRPAVVELPELPDTVFFPYVPVNMYLVNGVVGSLREQTEKYDLPRARQEANRLVRDLDEEVAALARELEIQLDYSVESLDTLGNAIVARYEKAGRDERRRLRTRGGLYVGAVLERKTGRGEWALFEEPKFAEFGLLHLDDWAPSESVGFAGARKEPGMLRAAVERRLARVTSGTAGAKP